MWKDVRYCALIDLPEGFAASVAGVTFRVDSNGALTWLRRHVLVPASLDSGWVRQYFQPPLLVGDRMVLTQPGAAALECVDVSSGHLYWRCVEPDLSRWIGSVGDSVIYQTGREIGARSIADGTLRWYRHVGPWLSAACLDGPNLFVASRQAASDPPNWFQPMLFCFDALSGRAIKVWPLSELADPDPRMGPLVSARGELWTFVGRGPNDPFRDLVELRLRGLERPPQPHESGPHEK